jgi:hypothetical protein
MAKKEVKKPLASAIDLKNSNLWQEVASVFLFYPLLVEEGHLVTTEVGTGGVVFALIRYY